MSTKKPKLIGQTCDRCGRPAVTAVEGEFFCEECYQIPGSCCPEFGGEDLWEVDEKKDGQASAQKKDSG